MSAVLHLRASTESPQDSSIHSAAVVILLQEIEKIQNQDTDGSKTLHCMQKIMESFQEEDLASFNLMQDILLPIFNENQQLLTKNLHQRKQISNTFDTLRFEQQIAIFDTFSSLSFKENILIQQSLDTMLISLLHAVTKNLPILQEIDRHYEDEIEQHRSKIENLLTYQGEVLCQRAQQHVQDSISTQESLVQDAQQKITKNEKIILLSLDRLQQICKTAKKNQYSFSHKTNYQTSKEKYLSTITQLLALGNTAELTETILSLFGSISAYIYIALAAIENVSTQRKEETALSIYNSLYALINTYEDDQKIKYIQDSLDAINHLQSQSVSLPNIQRYRLQLKFLLRSVRFNSLSQPLRIQAENIEIQLKTNNLYTTHSFTL